MLRVEGKVEVKGIAEIRDGRADAAKKVKSVVFMMKSIILYKASRSDLMRMIERD